MTARNAKFLLSLCWYASLALACFAQSAVTDAPTATNSLLQFSVAQERLAQYHAELEQFRKEFGDTRELPAQPFFLFGMGLRTKLLYNAGTLFNAESGAVIRKWDVAEDVIVPPDYAVMLRTKTGGTVRLREDENGFWIEDGNGRKLISGTDAPVRLPQFEEFRFPMVMRVLHQELLVNVTSAGPVPNFFVYKRPWYRDGAMMALAFRRTGNLAVIRDWILGLRDPYDRNNAGETEADNLGQALFLVSLVSDARHPLVAKIQAEVPRFEVRQDGAKFIRGRSDSAEHPVYQTKWLKFGLRALSLPDDFTIPRTTDGYSALFWMDYRDTYVPGRDADDRTNYPYLGWACDHFHGQRHSPISNRDYPLTWEAKASQARYEGMALVSDEFVQRQVAAPHSWHAAEILLYLLDQPSRHRADAPATR